MTTPAFTHDEAEPLFLECSGDQFAEFISGLKEQGGRLMSISAVSTGKGEVELMYYFDLSGTPQVLKSRTVDGVIESLYSLFQSADFMEREIHELYGVKFMGHPNLERSPIHGQGSLPEPETAEA